MDNPLEEKLLKQIANAQFFMLRYETEFTPCTGITAVTKQERRNFKHGIMIAPWCPKMTSVNAEKGPVKFGKVIDTNWKFTVHGKTCKVLSTTDDHAPILFLEVAGRFAGIETPYDVPLSTLREDTLYFGLAVDKLLKQVGTSGQFVWGADWESVPALVLVRQRHHISLTLHNTFDECLESESKQFGKVFDIFSSIRLSNGMTKTALEIGMEIADVVTTVNRGFSYGMNTEPIQNKVMAEHLHHLMKRVVGINNAAFSPLSDSLKKLRDKMIENPVEGRKALFRTQEEARAQLPPEISSKTSNKVIMLSMGRRVAQKLHDVLVESTRQILTRDKGFPMLLVFSTVHGDTGSPARLERMRQLQEEFPDNVICTDGRLTYFNTLMKAADYNCMPSLYEPHGGAFEGTVIPIARAIDGLAEQICALEPTGKAAVMNSIWHDPQEAPSGFLFREPASSNTGQLVEDLKELLSISPSPNNELFTSMRDALSEVLLQAVHLRRHEPERYAALVLAAIQKQENTSWDENLNSMLSLIEEARLKRKISW